MFNNFRDYWDVRDNVEAGIAAALILMTLTVGVLMAFGLVVLFIEAPMAGVAVSAIALIWFALYLWLRPKGDS